MSLPVAPNCPHSDLDIFCMDAILHPDKYDVVLREMAPVVYLPRYDMYVTGRHEHSQKILANDDQFSAFKRPFFEPASVRADILITDDRPKHPRVRRPIQRAMSPAVMRRMKEDFTIEADRLVDSIMANGVVELEGRRGSTGRGYASPTLIAYVYEGLGRIEDALDWLEQAVEERDGWVVYVNSFPRFESLRDEPRFEAVLRRLALPEN